MRELAQQAVDNVINPTAVFDTVLAGELAYEHIGRIVYLRVPHNQAHRIQTMVLAELRQLAMADGEIVLICTGIESEAGDQDEYTLQPEHKVYLPNEAEWKRLQEVWK